MNLQSTISIYGGGPGSGCTGPNCGRHALTDMLKQTTEQFKSGFGTWGTIYKKGHPGVIAPFTPEERKDLKSLTGRQQCRLGQCYMNAQRIAVAGFDDSRVKYMEGLVTVHGVPIDHAWIEFNGKVYDPTLFDSKFKLKQESRKDTPEYYGMEVPKDLILKNQLQMKTYSPLTQWPSKFAKQLSE